MPIIPSQKNPLVLLRSFRDELAARTNITNFDADTKTRVLIDVFSQEQLNSRSDWIDVFYSHTISNATGKDLERIGERLQVFRILNAFASAEEGELNVAFYVSSGTFGSYNSGSDIVIPAGTLIYSTQNQNELGSRIEYRVLADKTLPAASSIGYVSVQAVEIGSKYNVGKQVLRSHDFTNYIDSASGALKVLNFFPILNGQNEETDDSYRFRIANKYSSVLQNNETKILLNGLTVPGVKDLEIIRSQYGIGTVGVSVLGSENLSNARLVNGVQNLLEVNKAPSSTPVAVAAVQSVFDFEIEFVNAGKINTSQREEIKQQVNRIILNYFRSLGIGAVVSLNDLAAAIQNQVSRLVAFNYKKSNTLFKKVYVSRGYVNAPSDEKEKMISTIYALDIDEFAALGDLVITFVS